MSTSSCKPMLTDGIQKSMNSWSEQRKVWRTAGSKRIVFETNRMEKDGFQGKQVIHGVSPIVLLCNAFTHPRKVDREHKPPA